MTRQTASRRGSIRLNCLAALISTAAMLVLILSFQAAPAGAGHDARHALPQLAVPAPTTVAANSSSTTATGATKLDASADPARLQQQIQSAVHSSRVALELLVALLEVGRHRLEHTADYSASFYKQERLDGQDMQDLQNMQVKLRHAPFSVYMKWIEGGDRGRQVLYVDGKLDNRILVQLGGLKGKIMPPLKLEPEGSLAMKEARHPVTDMGLLNLTRKLIAYRQRDLASKKGVRWQLIPDQKCFERDCLCFVVEYDSKEFDPVYRKTLTFIDKQNSLPICVKNFAWPEAGSKLAGEALDEATCIEFYGYKDLQFNVGLKDNDFDRANEQYAFKK